MGYYHLHEAANSLERCVVEERCSMPAASHYSRSEEGLPAATPLVFSHRRHLRRPETPLRSPVVTLREFPGEPVLRGDLRRGDVVLDPAGGALWTAVEGEGGNLELANGSSQEFRMPTTGPWASLLAYRQAAG